jgi:hypothetical protein
MKTREHAAMRLPAPSGKSTQLMKRFHRIRAVLCDIVAGCYI